jgi:predicted outer membrane repeat protein
MMRTATLFLILLLCAGGVHAQTTHTVTNLSDTGGGSLRAAATGAASGDTIEFASGLAGTINFASQIDLGNTELTIIGNVDGTGAPAITLDGGGTVALLRSNASLELENLIVTNGYIAIGSVVWSDDDVTAINCTFTYNSGAILAGGDITCTDCTFSDNSTGSGALDASGTVTCTGCIFIDNTANQLPGGAIAALGPVICSRCVFIRNSADHGGGAIWSDVAVTCTDCTFTGNDSPFGGAILGAFQSIVTCTNCTFSDNTSNFGGAILGDYQATVSCRNCTFRNNTAIMAPGNTAGVGGAINVLGAVSCTNCTFSGNTAESNDGSTIWCDTSITAKNCIFADNGTGTMFDGGGTFTSYGYNLCTRPAADVPWLNQTGDQTNADPMLGPLQDNGGPVPTMLPTAQSPAIDQGGSVVFTTDARGFARTVDFGTITNAPGGDGTDIGAVERQASEPTENGGSNGGNGGTSGNTGGGGGCSIGNPKVFNQPSSLDLHQFHNPKSHQKVSERRWL